MSEELSEDMVRVESDKLYVCGQLIADHRVIEELGRGANGIVFRTHNTGLDRDEALKVWLKLREGDTRDKVQQGLMEARKLARAKGKYVAEIYHIAVVGPVAYATMEYIKSQTLREYSEGRTDTGQIVGLAYQYLEAIVETATPATRHGDPHWGNVLVYAENGDELEGLRGMKLIDFGTSIYSDQEFSETRHWEKVRETVLNITRRLPGRSDAMKSLKDFESQIKSTLESMRANPALFKPSDLARVNTAALRDYLDYWRLEYEGIKESQRVSLAPSTPQPPTHFADANSSNKAPALLGGANLDAPLLATDEPSPAANNKRESEEKTGPRNNSNATPSPVAGSPIYFFGCDMGGWHTEDGDALAICKWDGTALQHIDEAAGQLFYPIKNDSLLNGWITIAQEAKARIVIGVDAALAWPVKFVELVQQAPTANHQFNFDPVDVIDNPYLYRETERFIKRLVLTGGNERPLTAPGDKFGNNSSKAQALVAWIVRRCPNIYRPPFDSWERVRAAEAPLTLIEVYPAASMKSRMFQQLKWPPAAQSMKTAGNTDIADAKRCAMTAICYARSFGLLPPLTDYPNLMSPENAAEGSIDLSLVPKEGWIFSSRRG